MSAGFSFTQQSGFEQGQNLPTFLHFATFSRIDMQELLVGEPL